MPVVGSDRIEKTILLRAPRSRVWRALTDSQQFGTWFGVKFDEPFRPGTFQRGVIVPTTVDGSPSACNDVNRSDTRSRSARVAAAW